MIKHIAMLLTLTLILSGCSVMNSDFDCNKISGIKSCVSLDEVNKMTDDGALDASNAQITTTSSTTKGINGYLNTIPTIGEPVRFGDSIQKITIFPYEDTEGNYHEASVIYTVLHKSHWLSYPPKAIQSSEG